MGRYNRKGGRTRPCRKGGTPYKDHETEQMAYAAEDVFVDFRASRGDKEELTS